MLQYVHMQTHPTNRAHLVRIPRADARGSIVRGEDQADNVVIFKLDQTSARTQAPIANSVQSCALLQEKAQISK